MCNGTYLLGDRTLQCYCPNCDPLHDIRMMWYHGEAWSENPTVIKSRRRTAIRRAWHTVIDFEDWVYPIHTIACAQSSVRHGFHQLRRWGDQPAATTQERLSLMD